MTISCLRELHSHDWMSVRGMKYNPEERRKIFSDYLGLRQWIAAKKGI